MSNKKFSLADTLCLLDSEELGREDTDVENEEGVTGYCPLV